MATLGRMNLARLVFAAAGLVLLTGCGSAAPAPSAPAASPAANAASAKPAASAPTSAAASASPASGSPAASGSAAASGLKKVTVGFSQLTGSESVLYGAADRGSFKKYGIDANVTRVEGTTIPPAMQSGDLQLASIGGSELVSVNSGGLGIVMIAASHNVPVFSLYGAKGITDVKELAGKTIAVTSIGSATDAAAHLFMTHFGLDDQVKHQAAGTAQGILAALEHGDAAAGIISPPQTVKADQQGMKELVNGPKLGIPFVQAGLGVTRAYMQANPDTVKAFMQGYYESWRFTIDPANQGAVLQTIMKWAQTDQQSAKETYEYLLPSWSRKGMPEVDPAGIQTIIDLSSNPKAKSLKPQDLIDNSLLAATAK